MRDTFVARECEAQAAADAAAYRRLSRSKKRVASFLALAGFTGRQGLVGVSGWIVGGLDAVLYFLFIWPYVALSRLAAWSADSAMKIFVILVDACFGVAANILAAANALIRGLERRLRGTGSGRTLGLLLRTLEELRRSTALLARKVAISRLASIRFIETQWREAKASIIKIAKVCFYKLEYYGPIALYRIVKFILNPVRPSGKPLLQDERANRSFGLFMAALGFAGFTVLLIAVGVWAKILHAQLAFAFAADSGPMGVRLAKQIFFQPLITIGLTAAKAILLPIIAATRFTLKSADLSRGIAFAYNRRLRRRKRRDIASRAEAADVKKVMLPMLSIFVAHLVEKSAPTFYEGRLRWYRSRRIGVRDLSDVAHHG